MSQKIIPINNELFLVETTKRCGELNYNKVDIKSNDGIIHIGSYITGDSYSIDEQLLYNEYAIAIVYEKGNTGFTIGALYDISTKSFVCNSNEAAIRFNNYFNKKSKVKCINQ